MQGRLFLLAPLRAGSPRSKETQPLSLLPPALLLFLSHDRSRRHPIVSGKPLAHMLRRMYPLQRALKRYEVGLVSGGKTSRIRQRNEIALAVAGSALPEKYHQAF
jgi:hypothetical protein